MPTSGSAGIRSGTKQEVRGRKFLEGKWAEDQLRAGVVHTVVPGSVCEARAPNPLTLSLSQAHLIQKTLGISFKNMVVRKEGSEDGAKTHTPEGSGAHGFH